MPNTMHLDICEVEPAEDHGVESASRSQAASRAGRRAMRHQGCLQPACSLLAASQQPAHAPELSSHACGCFSLLEQL